MLLEARALCKEFTRRGSPFLAVDHAELRVSEGDFIGLSGSSGSGKTTLLTLFAGLAKPTSGTVVFDGGLDLAVLGNRALAALRGCGIAFVPQGQSLLPNLTVVDNIRLPCHLAGGNGESPGRAEYLLNEVGLSDLADSFPAQLSGGEMRRAAIARALMTMPRLLLADEPTGDLDEANTEMIIRLLGKAAEQGAAVLFSTHEQAVLKRAGRALFMAGGRLAESREGMACV